MSRVGNGTWHTSYLPGVILPFFYFYFVYRCYWYDPSCGCLDKVSIRVYLSLSSALLRSLIFRRTMHAIPIPILWGFLSVPFQNRTLLVCCCCCPLPRLDHLICHLHERLVSHFAYCSVYMRFAERRLFLGEKIDNSSQSPVVLIGGFQF